MQYAAPSCQLPRPRTGDSSLISVPPGDVDPTTPPRDATSPNAKTQQPGDCGAERGRGGRLLVVEAHQWLSTTASRIATCAHSWMQAVHWVAGSGLYSPTRSHGPKWGLTTIAIAKEISALTECRPGIDYLMRKLKVSERTVQYHLGMLREAGLLVYRIRGTRVSGCPNQASVFERVIPVEFDVALGIRTVGEGVQRRPVGIAEEGRAVIGKLAKKAARKVRKTRTRGDLKRASRCTPMQVGTSSVSPTALTHSPSEGKLAGGAAKFPTQKKSSSRPWKLNKVGRRYQLAGELIASVPWLGNASRARIAWIVRHVADAGWTALEVQAAAEQMPVAAGDARRLSGFLAYRLASCHLLYTTPARRKTLVEAWQESRAAEQARHTGYGQITPGSGHGPASITVQNLVAEAFRRNLEREAAGAFTTEHTEGAVDIEALDRSEVRQLRTDAEADPQLILSALTLMPERDVRRLYTNWLVDQALAAQRTLASAF
ncbi:winged helix-turn-helix domain-containing protein [Streptomyces sp. NPDC057681]|uniref:helix-turn-helix domain-containing protein n=1 Tax=Streptomyces sp. NPDC057681 TaxID=3346209 RepID=UPI003696D978